MLKNSATDEEILRFIDKWVSLFETEDYYAAFNLTQHKKATSWTPLLIREIIKSYGDCEPSQKVTLTNNGLCIDGADNVHPATQSKEVTWYNEKHGDVWYDLNIDGYVSDLTALFDLEKTDTEINVFLDDIHVM